jgi:hypothetical protein
VRKGSNQVALICVSDLHLGITPPVFRSAEKNWMCVQEQRLNEIRTLAGKYGAGVVYTGDIFHNWNSPPELVNWVLSCLPDGFSVAGNHDTPHHRPADLNKSAYMTLIRAGKLVDLSACEFTQLPRVTGLKLVGFPFGSEFTPADRGEDDKDLWIAVVHHYVWVKGKSHPGAKEEDRAKNVLKTLKGFDVVLAGDNHRGFKLVTKSGRTLFNAGGMMVRNSDEKDYKPMCGLVHYDGTVKEHHFDVSKDKYNEDVLAEVAEYGLDEDSASAISEAVHALGKHVMGDFRDALRRYCESHDVKSGVRELIARLVQKEEKR